MPWVRADILLAAELAGRKVQCVRGQLRMATMKPMDDDDELYALADEPAPATPGRTVPAKAGEGAVARPLPRKVQPLAYREESTTAGVGSHVSEYFPDRVRDLYLPVGLIAFGTVVEVIASWAFAGPRGFSLTALLRDLGADLVIATAIMLAAILLAGKLRQIDFGKLPVAILKLSAVVVGTIGISFTFGVTLGLIPILGYAMALLMPFVAFYTLLRTLFDLDEPDANFTTVIMIAVWLVYMFAIRPLMG
jgi:hypothetical protein